MVNDIIRHYEGYIVVKGNDSLYPEKNTRVEITNDELHELYENKYRPYRDRLRTTEWKVKREEVMTRDGYKCRRCGAVETTRNHGKLVGQFFVPGDGSLVWQKLKASTFTDSTGKTKTGFQAPLPDAPPTKDYKLVVHHIIYSPRRDPWDYDNKYLVTLCHHCHTYIHEKKHIPVFTDDLKYEIVLRKCSQCDGRGYLQANGDVNPMKCPKCNGARLKEELIDSQPPSIEKALH